MRKYFGTDGVRGIVNEDLTPDLAYKLGKSAGLILKKYSKNTNAKPKFLIGTDTRISKDLLFTSLSSGLMSVGCDVVYVGVVPTPVVAYLTKKNSFDAGVVISASHNPFEYNGIKFFNSQGLKLSDEVELEIEQLLDSNLNEIETHKYSNVGSLVQEELDFEYIDYIENLFAFDLSGIKIVLDCANGAAYKIAPEIFKKFGADIIVINNEPNGININDNAGSTHTEHLSKTVKENKADLGLAYDGDADRLIAIDENGKEVDGDIIMLLIANKMKEDGKLKNNKLAVTVMSNLGLHESAKQLGIDIEMTSVGDRYVLERMLEKDLSIGGEQSGHMIFLDYNTTGDGIITSLLVAKILKEKDNKMSELLNIMTIYPQVLVNAKVKNENKEKYKTDNLIQSEIKKLENTMSNEGRVLIRHSGTEPLVRVMIEGKDYDMINDYANHIAKLIENILG